MLDYEIAKLMISIHAPREGSDGLYILAARPGMGNFNPRSP